MRVEYKIISVLSNGRKAFSSNDILLVYLVLVIFVLFCFAQSTIPPKSTYNNLLKDIDVSRDPVQSVCYMCKSIVKNVKGTDYNIMPVANYGISGIVLAKNDFFVMDDSSDIGTIDVGLAWGKMANPEYDKYMKYSSSERFLHWNYSSKFPFTYDFLNSHVSHNHIIPADDNILRTVKSFKIKEKVYMEGYLVNVTTKSGFRWNTSLTRTDAEAGACEVFYVKKVQVGNNIYE